MIPLHVHSNYSLLQGTISIDKLIEFCKNNSISSIALTDTNAMNGLIQFAKKAYEAGIQPILGTCLTEPGNDKKYVICIAKNNEGYSDICRIITQRKLNDDFSLIKILKTEWKNLIIITPHIELLEIINQKNSFYAEIIPTKSNKKNALKLYEYSKQNNISIVASNPVYFLEKKDFELHKLVTAIRLNKTIASISDEELVDEEFYFKSSTSMEHQFKKIPEAIANTHKIAEECKVDLNLGEYKYPSYNTNQKENSLHC